MNEGFEAYRLPLQLLFTKAFSFPPRERFVELFDEKARELNKLEAEFADCKEKLEASNRRILESEYKGNF